jgi:hypothetical protein
VNLASELDNVLTPPIPLFEAVTRLLGERWLGWDPEVVRHELIREISSLRDIPRENQDKLQAMRFLRISNAAWNDWHVFAQTTLALNGVPIDPESAAILAATHMAYAVDVMKRVDPEKQFSQDVVWFIAAMLNSQGYTKISGTGERDFAAQALADLVNTPMSVLCKRSGGSDTLDDPEEIEEAQLRMDTINTYLEAKLAGEARMRAADHD